MKNRKMILFTIFLVLIIVVMIIFNVGNSNRNSYNDFSIIPLSDIPNSVYLTLETNEDSVVAGGYIDVTVGIHNVEELVVPTQDGAAAIYLTMFFDSSMFEVPFGDTYLGRIILEDDFKPEDGGEQFKIFTNTIMGQEGFRKDDLICEVPVSYPNHIEIQIGYSYYHPKYHPLTENGNLFTLRFKVKDDAFGSTTFYMNNETDYDYCHIEGERDYLEIPIDNTIAQKTISILGAHEPTYTINYDSRGGSVVPPTIKEQGETIVAPGEPNRTGYVFDNWYTSVDGGQTLSALPYIFDTMPNYDFTLYAKWNPINYKVKYNSNGGMGDMEEQKVEYDQSFSLRDNTFVFEGYTFKGWAKALAGPKVYNNKQTVSNLLTTPGEIILYAVWEKNAYQLTFGNYLTITRDGVNLSSDSSIYKEDVLTITYSRTGYLSAIIKANNITIEGDIYTVDTTNVTLTVHDEQAITYYITYNLDGGVNHDDNIDEYNVTTPTITLKDPTKAGFNFVGWYTASTGGTKVTSIATGSTGDKTLYARWLEDDIDNVGIVSIVIKTEEGSIIKTITEVSHLMTILVNNQFSKVVVTLVLENEGATFTVTPGILNLEVGIGQVVTITVTAKDGITTDIYNLVITRKVLAPLPLIEEVDILGEQCASFKKLSSDGTLVDCIFDKTTTVHYICVDADQTDITLKLNTTANSTIKGYDSNEIYSPLSFGDNVFTYTVVSEDETLENTYVFVVKRNLLSNITGILSIIVKNVEADLSVINNNMYKIRIPPSISDLELEIILEDDKANYTVVGNANLNNEDIFYVVVTAENGETETYFIEIEKYSLETKEELIISVALCSFITVIFFGFSFSVVVKRRPPF